jgi:hypothetical protein
MAELFQVESASKMAERQLPGVAELGKTNSSQFMISKISKKIYNYWL